MGDGTSSASTLPPLAASIRICRRHRRECSAQRWWERRLAIFHLGFPAVAGGVCQAEGVLLLQASLHSQSPVLQPLTQRPARRLRRTQGSAQRGPLRARDRRHGLSETRDCGRSPSCRVLPLEAGGKPIHQPDRSVSCSQKQPTSIRRDRAAIEPPPRGSAQVQIQTASGYTLSASGNTSASAKVLLAKELSPIRNPDAPTQREICGPSVTGPPLSIPFECDPVAGVLLLSGVGARPPPDGV